MWQNILCVFIGSGLGGVLRWAIGHLASGIHPYSTLIINVLGCFFLGFLSRHLPVSHSMQLLLMTGFCGGFTTFSTFVGENLFMLHGGALLQAILYTLLSLTLGLLACWIGYDKI